MDDLDRRLIGLLRANARTPVADLAKKLGVARGTVQNRMARLERDGTIAGYTVRLKPETGLQRIAALMTIAIEGNRADEEQVLKTLRGDPNVAALHTTNGRWDLIADLRADSLQEFEQVLNRVRRLEGIAQTETSILLSTYKM
jgi:DNA-binding Lrp family transcriptional regulator